MIYEFLYEDRVDSDIDEALDFYFPINVELSDAFLDRVEEAKLKILNSPKVFEMIHKTIRTVLLKQFPYHIYYILDGIKIIVLAIIHAESGPEKISKI